MVARSDGAPSEPVAAAHPRLPHSLHADHPRSSALPHQPHHLVRRLPRSTARRPRRVPADVLGHRVAPAPGRPSPHRVPVALLLTGHQNRPCSTSAGVIQPGERGMPGPRHGRPPSGAATSMSSTSLIRCATSSRLPNRMRMTSPAALAPPRSGSPLALVPGHRARADQFGASPSLRFVITRYWPTMTPRARKADRHAVHPAGDDRPHAGTGHAARPPPWITPSRAG